MAVNTTALRHKMVEKRDPDKQRTSEPDRSERKHDRTSSEQQGTAKHKHDRQNSKGLRINTRRNRAHFL